MGYVHTHTHKLTIEGYNSLMGYDGNKVLTPKLEHDKIRPHSLEHTLYVSVNLIMKFIYIRVNVSV
jgi:hypothetical protein